MLLALFMVMFALNGMDSKHVKNVNQSIEKVFTGQSAQETQISENVKNSEILQNGESILEHDGKTLLDGENGILDAEKILEKLKNDTNIKNNTTILKEKRGVVIRLNDTMLFDQGSAIIKPEALATLENISEKLREFNNPVLIEGHTDSTPIKNEKYPSNWELSTARATNIISYLIEKQKLPPERLSAVNRTIPALRLLKTALSEGNLSDSALFKASTLYASGKMYTEAESIARGLLEKNPENPEYVEHFAGLLYLQNKFQEGIEFLNNNPSVTGNSGKLQNLLGNFYSALVKWEDAAAAYRRASELEENGLFLFNLGDILEKINDKEAVKAYQKAASVFLNENNLTDLEETVHRLDTLDKKSVKTKAIKAKYYFASGEEEKALPVIRELTAGNTKDSALWYLSGLLKRNSRDLSGSSADFEKALDLEPDYPMYLFRLSENRLDEGNTAESLSLIDKALAGDKENGWFWNQKARCFMAENNLEEALELLKEAEERLPDEFSVWENKGEIYRRMGQWDSMADIFNPLSPAARRAALLNPGKAFNFCGNMYTKDGKYALALEFYQKAVDAEKENPVFLINKASADIEEGNLSEADALLGKAYEIKHSPEIYNLLGTLAEIKGEYPRAEVAFRQGLEEFPDEPDLLYSLVQHYYGLGKFEKADALLSALNKKEKSKRVQEITDAVQEKTSRIISCSRCGRKWAVPFYIPPQGRISLQAEPPDEMPAGRCPVCGKTFCIGCGKENLGNDGRFKCPDCNENLRLMDEGLIYTLNKWIEEQNLEK